MWKIKLEGLSEHILFTLFNILKKHPAISGLREDEGKQFSPRILKGKKKKKFDFIPHFGEWTSFWEFILLKRESNIHNFITIYGKLPKVPDSLETPIKKEEGATK